jgi:hypothetical protein
VAQENCRNFAVWKKAKRNVLKVATKYVKFAIATHQLKRSKKGSKKGSNASKLAK